MWHMHLSCLTCRKLLSGTGSAPQRSKGGWQQRQRSAAPWVCYPAGATQNYCPDCLAGRMSRHTAHASMQQWLQL